MSKEMVISSSRHETRLAIMEGDQLVEVFFQRENEYSLAGSIHKGRVTRVLPGMQSAFVDLGLERDTFLYVSDFYEDNTEDFDRLTDDRPAKTSDAGGGGGGRERGERGYRGGRGDRGGDRRRGGGGNEQAAIGGAVPPPLPPPLPDDQETAVQPVLLESMEGALVEPLAEESIASAASGAVASAPAARSDVRQGDGRQGDGRHSGGRPDGRGRDDRGGDRGGDRGRRGRGRGGRRGGFPDSKYSSSTSSPAPYPSREPVGASDPSPNVGGVARGGEMELEPLPGESLARFAGSSSEVATSFARTPTAVPLAVQSPRAESFRAESFRSESFLDARDPGGDADLLEETPDVISVSDDPVEHPSANAIPDAPIHAERLFRVDDEADAAQEAAEREADAHAVEDAVERFTAEDVDALQAEAEAAADGGSDEGEESAADGAGESLDDVQESAERAAQDTPVTAEVRGGDRDRRYLRGGRRGRRGRGRGGERGERPAAGPAVEGQPAVVAEGAEARSEQRPEARPEQRPEQRSEQRSEQRPEQRGPRPDGRAEHRSDNRDHRGGGGMPLISDLLKEGQEIIVQIAKEPLGQKGARITSHIALPGRYVVYMPTLDHMGVSRKIDSDEERHRLKRVLQAARGQITGGCIIRTAGEGQPEDEILADILFLFKLWQDIKQKAEKRPAPLLLHHDLDIVQRVLRDQLTEEFKSVWVDNEEMYESVLRFMQRFQPALLNRVKLFTRPVSIFDAFNITAELEKALRPKVWLKSGGYIVINQTEALVAIDINTGKFVGKSNRLEDTIVKTNLEAVKEIVRQIRLRDLGGIIVIDFIDMDERRNRQKVMQSLEEALRQDRAPFKVLQFNDFGLVAITRKRVKQSLERTMCSPCPYCEGAGYLKSVTTVIGEIVQEAYKISSAMDGSDVVLRVNPEVAKVLKSSRNQHLEELEEILKRPVLVKSDATLHQEKFDLA